MPIVFDAPKIHEMMAQETPATLDAKRMSIIKSGSMIGLKVEHLPLSEPAESGGAAGGKSSAIARYSALARENLETMKRALTLIEGRSKPAPSRPPSRKGESDAYPRKTPKEKAAPGARVRESSARLSLPSIEESEREEEEAEALAAAAPPEAAKSAKRVQGPSTKYRPSLPSIEESEGEDAAPLTAPPPAEESTGVEETK